MGIGNPRDEYYSNGEGLLPPEPVSPQTPPLYNSPCIQDEDSDVRSTPADYQEEHSAGEFHHFYVFCLMHFLESSTNFNEIYCLYINDLGDHDLLDDDEDAAELESMADLLHDIV